MIARNNISIKVIEDDPLYPADALTANEVAIIQAQIPLKIYEPVCVTGELLFVTNGDTLVAFGGNYAA